MKLYGLLLLVVELARCQAMPCRLETVCVDLQFIGIPRGACVPRCAPPASRNTGVDAELGAAAP